MSDDKPTFSEIGRKLVKSADIQFNGVTVHTIQPCHKCGSNVEESGRKFAVALGGVDDPNTCYLCCFKTIPKKSS
jgi:hypothetical protein